MSRSASAIPFDAPAPAEAFARLAARRGVFWLDSSLPRADDGRFSMMGCEPRWNFTARGGDWHLGFHDGRGDEVGQGAPLERLNALLNANRVAPAAGIDLPFWGGAVGWLSYDLGRQFERIDGTAQDDLGVPDIQLAWHDAAVVWDHHRGGAWLVGSEGERPATTAIEELAEWLRASPPAPVGETTVPTGGAATSDFSRADYLARVAEVREGIARGDYYQLNLVQRFECAHVEPPAATYLRLRALNPAPFSAYLAAGEWTVLSSSPERFLEVAPDGRVRTCPIKGTRPRGATPAEDAALQAELLASEKERAELLMIVDLLRNDLGRVCEFGSVAVKRLHALESFATVHHLVGEVTGRLRRDVTLADLLRATFPGGSITGAPKISAMRAIDRLEPHRRGLGMGALGYISAHGRIDLNIAIRTILCRGGRASLSLGAGIVADSEPAAEYEETLAKGRALFEALGVQPGDSGSGGRDDSSCSELDGSASADVGAALRRDSLGQSRRKAAPAVAENITSIATGRASVMVVDGEFVSAPSGAMTELPEAAGVFETVLIKDGAPIYLADHWARFAEGCRWHGFATPTTAGELTHLAQHLARENQVRTGVLRFAARRHGDRVAWRLEVGPPRPHMALAEFRVTNGGPVLPLATPDRAFKHLRRADWARALREARAAGWDEVLLCDSAGRLVEGGSSNVFFVADGLLHTPSLAVGPLPGVIRAQVLAFVRARGWPVREGEFSLADVARVSEIWFTNSLIGIRPTAELAGRRLDALRPVLDRLREAWRETHGWDPLVMADPVQ